MFYRFPILLTIALCFAFFIGNTAEAGKKDSTPADSIKLLPGDIDTTYSVLKAVGAISINADPAKYEDELHKEIRKYAAQKGADVVINFQIIKFDVRRLGVSKQKYGDTYLAIGVAVKLIDSTSAIEWEKKHPPKKFDPKAPVEILEKDAKQAYDVIGVAYGYTQVGRKDSYALDDALRKFAKSSFDCMAVDGCNAIIHTEYDIGGWSSWGVMVKYRSP